MKENFDQHLKEKVGDFQINKVSLEKENYMQKTDTFVLQKQRIRNNFKMYLPYVVMTFSPSFKGF